MKTLISTVTVLGLLLVSGGRALDQAPVAPMASAVEAQATFAAASLGTAPSTLHPAPAWNAADVSPEELTAVVQRTRTRKRLSE